MSNSKRAHTEGSGEASTQAFLACMLFPRHLPLLSPWRDDTQLPTQQVRAQVEGARSPKAGQSRQHHTAHLQDAGTWAGGTQDSQDAVVELLPPPTSSYTSHPMLHHHRQQAVQTWEVKPRTAAGEGWMQKQESQGLFTSHTAMEPWPESPFLTCSSSC